MKTIQIFTFLLMSISNMMFYAKEGKLLGRVTDANGVPAPYAIVSLIKDGEVVNGANADDQGKYDIQPIDPGTYDVKAEVLDAAVTINNVMISENQTQFLDISLSPAMPLPEPDYVLPMFSQRRLLIKDPIQFRTISGNEFRHSALGRN